MRVHSLFLILVAWVTAGTVRTAEAQPSHPEHRYMVSEHTGIKQLAGYLDRSFHGVEIKRLDVPEVVPAGESALYSVIANVATASLPITAEWDFGDGSKKKGLSVHHVYSAPGTYEVTVRVSNRQSSEKQTVTVEVGDVQLRS